MASSIRGVDSLNGKLAALERVLKSEAVRNAVGQGCHVVRAEAVNLVPKDKGELVNSIMTKVDVTNDGVVGIVYTNKEYAPYVELGTGSRGAEGYSGDLDISYNTDWAGQAPQPYLYPALKNNEENVVRDIREVVSEEIRRVTGNA